ncbi:MAG: transglutaminase family protein [Planctomycetota bacterium]
MHAWAEVYLPVLGWRGFDPTLGEAASLKHIVVGVTRGVMPISGMFTGASADYIDMIAPVKLERLDDVPIAS